MWPGFDSRFRRHVVELLVLVLAQRVFSPGTPVLLPPQNDPEAVEEEPLCGVLKIPIYYYFRYLSYYNNEL